MKLVRIVFHVAAAISLLLLVAAIACWIRSYVAGDSFHWYGDGRECSFGSARGQFVTYRVWSGTITQADKFTYTTNRGARQWFVGRKESLLSDPGLRGIGALGVLVVHGKPNYADRFVEIWLPWWLITLATAALPGVWLRRWRKHRHPPGTCQHCGYDLRATPDLCPECGRAPAAVTP